MDRRTTIQWVLAASAAWPLGARRALSASPAHPAYPADPAHRAPGYGTDPDLVASYAPGQIWPLTLTPSQRRLAACLSDLIIPADEHSPSASAVGVVDFIDEWLSAPYPNNRQDRTTVLEGFQWLDAESTHRFGKEFGMLPPAGQMSLCNDICSESQAAPERRKAAQFFALYRDLTAGGFYSTAAGRKDLGYIGNVALQSFAGPPAALLRKLNLS
ncbi:MAG TPA: gluconate 2-dehydrogenase subunit 3 family protein [Steroidobacteraceae bacterium]|jgi:hypothetical protein